MEFSERYSIDERMVCIVFKKAFDTVSKGFLFRTLSFFGFGPSFIQWIHTQFTRISRLHPLQLKERVRQETISLFTYLL